MHMKLCDLQLTRYAGTIIFPKRFLPKERWNVTAIAEARAEIEKHLAILDKQLAGKTYLVAEQFSLAEVCYMPFLDFLPLMEITPPIRRGRMERNACLLVAARLPAPREVISRLRAMIDVAMSACGGRMGAQLAGITAKSTALVTRRHGGDIRN